MKKCDNMSVGILAWRGDELLMIQRKKEPCGFAPPAGHLDGDSYPKACAKEFKEETGLSIVGAPRPVVLLNGGYSSNECRRGGQYHYWQIFEVKWTGELKLNKEETLGVGWIGKTSIELLAEITEKYRAGKMTERRWRSCPGLEPIWYDFFKELAII
jgi:ADP-ribose pyrophosphatase YjhB (NUDIX family)